MTEARTEGDGHDASPSPAVTPVEPDSVQGLPELEVEPAEGLSEPEPEAEAEAEPLPAPEPEPLSEPEPLPAPEPEPLVQGQAPATPAAPDEPVQGFTFGKRDPMDKARRLARVLVSDMVMYNAERHQEALANGTLAEDFEEEIEKSWKEFVEQVGAEIAEGEGQHFWTQALNDILAKGQTVF